MSLQKSSSIGIHTIIIPIEMQIIKSQNEAPAKHKNIFKIRMISLNIVLDLSYLYEIISLLTYYFEILLGYSK